jgi:hypothetical protein
MARQLRPPSTRQLDARQSESSPRPRTRSADLTSASVTRSAQTAVRQRAGVWAAAGVVLCAYAFALYALPKDVFWHPDEGGKFLGVQAIHWEHGIEYTLPYPGRVVDPELRFYPGRRDTSGLYPTSESDGHVRFHWPVWFPLLTRVPFDIFGTVGIYLIPLLSGWLMAVVAGRWASTQAPRYAPAAIVLVGCATPVGFYALGFFEHTLAGLLGALALSALISARPGRFVSLTFVLLCLTIAIVLRIEMLVFAAALASAWVVSAAIEYRERWAEVMQHPPRCLRLSAIALICGAATLAVILVRSLAVRHWQMVADIPGMVAWDLAKLPYLLKAAIYVFVGPSELGGELIVGAWDIAAFLAMSAAAVAPFVRSKRLESVLILPALVVLLEVSLRMVLSKPAYLSRQGVVSVAPYLVVGLYVLPYAWNRRDRRLLCLAVAGAAYAAAGFFALFTARVGHQGNYLIGLDGPSRYMLSLYPLGVVLTVIALQIYRASDRSTFAKSAFAVLVVALMIVSLLYEFQGFRMLRLNRQRLVSWQVAFAEQGAPVVTDVWWLPAALAPFFATHEMYCVEAPAAISGWLNAALEHGESTFTFASFEAVDPGQFGARDSQIIPVREMVVAGLHIAKYQATRSDGVP